jgi:hypothetical protein
MTKITIVEYLASQAEQTPPLLTQVQKMLISYGYKKADNVKQLWQNLKSFIKDYRTEALVEITKLHPDRDIIIEQYENERAELVSQQQMNEIANPTNDNIQVDEVIDLGFDGAYPKCGEGKKGAPQRIREGKSNYADGDSPLPVRTVAFKEYAPALLIGAGVLLVLAIAFQAKTIRQLARK